MVALASQCQPLAGLPMPHGTGAERLARHEQIDANPPRAAFPGGDHAHAFSDMSSARARCQLVASSRLPRVTPARKSSCSTCCNGLP
jgi:hypothetical protein